MQRIKCDIRGTRAATVGEISKVHQKRLKGGARKRTIFCGILSDIFHSNFDRWHDTEVAALCEIAFDCKDIFNRRCEDRPQRTGKALRRLARVVAERFC